MKCKECKKTNPEGSKFCAFCGANLIEEAVFKYQDLFNKVTEHLEFIGYEIGKLEKGEDGSYLRVLATHNNRSNLLISFTDKGTMYFVSFYRINKDKVNKKILEALTVINKMNNTGSVCSYSFPEGNNNLVCSSWYPGEYSKKCFSDFLELYEADIQGRISSSGILDFTE